MPSSSHHNAAKVAQTLGTPGPGDALSLPGSFTTGTMSDIWAGPEPEENEEDVSDSTTALYHDAIRSQVQQQQQQQQTLATGQTMSANRNCSIDIYNLPEGTTLSQVLDTIARHRPVGHIYKCELLQVPNRREVSMLRVVRIRFKTPDSASCLFRIGNQPGLGLRINGTKTDVRFTRLPTSAYTAAGTRAVVFRGPRDVTSVDNLKRVWGDRFLWNQVEKVMQGPVGLNGIREVEWRFYEFAWGAQVAKCLFEDMYGQSEDCSARYGVDPCA